MKTLKPKNSRSLTVRKSQTEKKENEEGKVGPGSDGTEAQVENSIQTQIVTRGKMTSQHSSGNGNDSEMITKEELEQQADGECEEEEEDDDGETPESSHKKS
ncbi:Translocation protein SEC62 [Heterocephalus glaber]|uniref:Translocation protein SEC62 n=1 Tax=Heterocephalus glaber TaxID=10181 RepID=G5B3Z2_HETGA|nr:Translocation protein SEC62 [Heterocephalus glaber]